MNRLTEEGKYHMVSPESASCEDVMLAHSSTYIDEIIQPPIMFEITRHTGGEIVSLGYWKKYADFLSGF